MLKTCFQIVIMIILALAAPGIAYAADGMPDDVASTSYFPVLPFDAAPNSSPQLVPVATNHPLDDVHGGLTSAVIVIHDFTRDARGAMAMVASLAGAENANTMIVAPQFLLDFDVTRFASKLPDHGRMFARWTLGGWENGGNSIPQPPGKAISTFTVVDLLLIYLSDKKFFPDMKHITVAGHGAGGDFVQRYAATGRATELLEEQRMQVRFLVADASSYLYLTEQRPKAEKSGKIGFGRPDAAGCAGFDDFGYGLGKPNDYVRHVGASAIKLNYASRSVAYLVGEKAAVSDPLPDSSCPAMLEGADRVTRAGNFDLYLHQTFGDDVADRHKFFMISKTGYDPVNLFGSSCGMSVLFGDGNCALPHITGSGIPQ